MTMIRPEAFDFLSELAQNNNREWFQANKARHEQVRTNVIEFAQSLIIGISAFDKSVPADLDPKKCVMRIYRDIRFSNNKTPYKSSFGIGISAQGKNINGPGYYMHIHPAESFIAGGYWLPESAHLQSIRQEIDYNGAEFHSIIKERSFKEYFGEPDQAYKLKTKPKGYPSDHPDIDYLKLKSFTFTHVFDQQELKRTDAVKKTVRGFETLYPFMTYLRSALL